MDHLRFFQSMDQFNRAILGTNDLEQMMDDALKTVFSIFDCDRASLVYPCDPMATSWQVPMEHTRPEYPGVRSLGIDMPIDPEVARKFRILTASDGPVKFGPGSEHPLPFEVAQRFDCQSLLCMALHPKVGKPWELVLHQCSYPRIWTPEEERLFQGIAQRLTDALTGFLSYRHLQESEAKYRRIVDTADEGIWMFGEDLITTFVNTRMAEMIGYQTGELTGRPLADFIFEEDLPEHQRRMENRFHGRIEHYERRLRHKNGQVIWTQISATPILNEAQNFNGSFGMITDITDLKKTEDALRKLNQELEERVAGRTGQLESANKELEKAGYKVQQYLDIAGVILIAIDADRRVTLINQKGCEVLGKSSKDIIGKDWLETFVPENTRQEVIRIFNQLIAGRIESVEYFENPVLTQTGEERLIAWHNVLLRDEEGKITGTLSSGEDITEKKHTESQIRRLNLDLRNRAVALESANKELEAFAYSVSHDLRAPLRGIDGFSQILLEEYEDRMDEQGKNYLNRVRSAAQRMAQLIDDLLGLSRVGRSDMTIQQVNLTRIALEIADGLHKTDPGRQVEFVIQEEIKAQGDARLLRIVLENLIGNAWKFTSKHPRAQIEFGQQQQKDSLVYFIRDDGAGFDMKYADKLFGAFQRLHTAKEFPGTGVGLATVQRIIHRHGGRIWAKGEVEKGAVFYFTI
jgi:PAS domain S-box-containing protein